ncbi:PLD nuclease N-terminal domain-containing protein [Cellulomonas massiliensis]|uniref:PLD nuclease N-terminal domain-containing protein n=1 Tax=Cellulomonas massiliensis TaxID=1465811 RepID=UPI00030087A7|nr:PLD nuclease N-terminal domain-containing protein [Cellulomonas massiliensis]
MLRYVPLLLELGLLVYCLIDCVQADPDRVRNLPKVVWVFLIVLVPIVGGIAWLVAGRPERAPSRAVPWPSTQTAGFPEYERPRRSGAPDDDPEFLASMRRSDDTHERMLRDWEDDLRRREDRLRESPPDDERSGERQGG